MWGLLHNEARKYRGSYIVGLSQLGMAFPVLLVVGMFLIEKQDFLAQDRYTYETFTLYVTQLFVLLVGPIITSFIASFSIYYEYQQATMNNLLSSPHTRGSILLAKLIYVCILVILQYALVAILCPVLASLIGVQVSWQAAITQGGYYCLTGAVTLVLVPMMMLVTLLFRSFVPAMVLSVVGTAANILALNWDKSYLSPWAIPADFLLILWKNLNMDITYPIISFGIYMTLTVLAAFLYFTQADQPSA